MAEAGGVRETRRDIMRSAADLFAELGYRNTSIRAIAAGAGCDPALVPHYFASKEALYGAVVAETVRPADVLREAVERRDPEAAEWLLRHAVADWEDPAQRRRILGVLRSALDLPAARRRLSRALLPEALVDGDDGDEIRVWLISSLLIGVMTSRHMGLLAGESNGDGGGDVERLVDALVPVVAALLVTEAKA
ncbi:TetR/AcrR family transcriptional regulator [Streptomyces sp. Li-HN-5-11]|uniref:TetR/AcrR family transcriptional regulator n=1 Tax=Streptomyces sp. Li-HN-5-11 TaxID=3075432 RepID=UPI0028AC84F3|nr:TetR/AcrR family transcriptional regulator [Streptomyces sp. Li-HN-5-11]WNM31276.1 TetR/AcrR family transcriptional regulator [Streptomyces sp. Li-HN-5-11]